MKRRGIPPPPPMPLPPFPPSPLPPLPPSPRQQIVQYVEHRVMKQSLHYPDPNQMSNPPKSRFMDKYPSSSVITNTLKREFEGLYKDQLTQYNPPQYGQQPPKYNPNIGEGDGDNENVGNTTNGAVYQ